MTLICAIFSFAAYLTGGLYGDDSSGMPLNVSPFSTNRAEVTVSFTARLDLSRTELASLLIRISVLPVMYSTSPVSKSGTVMPAKGFILRFPRVSYMRLPEYSG